MTIPLPLLRSSSSKAFTRLSSPFTVTEEQKPTFKSALLKSPTALTVTWDSKLMRAAREQWLQALSMFTELGHKQEGEAT